MKYQHVAFKVEEANALYAMYTKTRQVLAQVHGMLELAQVSEHKPSAEEAAKLDNLKLDSEKRLKALETLLGNKIGGKDLEDSLLRLQEQEARLTHIQTARAEHVALRTELDMGLELGAVSPEDRKQAETILSSQKTRMEVLCKQAENALPGERLVLL